MLFSKGIRSHIHTESQTEMSSLRTIKATSRRLFLETSGGTEKGRGLSTQQPPPGLPAPESPGRRTVTRRTYQDTQGWAAGSGPGSKPAFQDSDAASLSALRGPPRDLGRRTRPLEDPLSMRTPKRSAPGSRPPESPGTSEKAVWMTARGEALTGGVRKTILYPGWGRPEWTVFSILHARYLFFFHRGSRDGKRSDAHRGRWHSLGPTNSTSDTTLQSSFTGAGFGQKRDSRGLRQAVGAR